MGQEPGLPVSAYVKSNYASHHAPFSGKKMRRLIIQNRHIFYKICQKIVDFV